MQCILESVLILYQGMMRRILEKNEKVLIMRTIEQAPRDGHIGMFTSLSNIGSINQCYAFERKRLSSA
ncbi:MAG TPA: hypothetical protein DHV65_12015 [Ktedonobacter sp.]|nr:hypothetical protein [Ktedonobacter sp.]